jgi:hypothetical protein
MTDRITSLTERYSALGDDELRNISVTGGLTAEASELLQRELRRRGISDLGEYKEHLQRVDDTQAEKKRHALQRKEARIGLYLRVGYGVSFLGILAGLFALYVQHDERNGVGMIVASVILLPIVWVLSLARRLLWRLLLRP